MRIAVDRVKCTGLGLCEAAAPAVFEIADDGGLDVLSEEVPAEQADAVRAAVDGCPTRALALVEE
jgi:ferredoxin